MREIYPGPPGPELADTDLADRYAYPGGTRGGQAYLRANMVASVDGAATLRGRSGGLSGAGDRHVFALLRSLADVILVGAGTARAERYGPVRPAAEGTRWAWLREGRPASAPIAVLTRRLDLDASSALLAASPADAQTIVLTTRAAPAERRALVSRTARVVVAGDDEVDLRAALTALTSLGYQRVLTEGGPHLLRQVIEAGLLDELCLTVSPMLTAAAAGRIVAAPGRRRAGQPGRLTLAHVLVDDGHLLCRYLSQRPGGAAGPLMLGH